MPRISIVLPVHNGMPFLSQSIESVLGQTMTDWELIVWDDGSTDASWDTIGAYSDPRIRVFRNRKNRGLFETLNAAIREARGEFIRLWSQDDVMKAHCLATEAAFPAADRVGMIYCQYDVIDESGTVIVPAPNDITPEVITPELAAQIMFHHSSITGNIANVTLRRDVIERVGLFREDMRVAGDFEMWVRISREHSIGFVRQPLLLLRRHKSQFSQRTGVNVLFMRECRPIFDELMTRLPPEARTHAEKYRRRHHLVLDAHYMLRSFVRGQFKIAADAYREIAQSDRPWVIVALLLLTADGRLFRPTPKYFPS